MKNLYEAVERLLIRGEYASAENLMEALEITSLRVEIEEIAYLNGTLGETQLARQSALASVEKRRQEEENKDWSLSALPRVYWP